MRPAAYALLALVGLTACSTTPTASSTELIIAVNAPLSRTPYIGTSIEQGVRLAVNQINAKGGIDAGAGRPTA